jgi:hypothetical protein
MREIWGSDLKLLDDELLRRQGRNREYMMSLQSKKPVMNFSLRAGRGNHLSGQGGDAWRMGVPHLPAARPFWAFG